MLHMCTRLSAMAVIVCSIATCATAPGVSLQPLAAGFDSPVFVCAAPGDTARLFIVEQSGKIKVSNLSTGSVSTFLQISQSTTGTALISGGEQGLLGLAFHPNYATNGFFFVNYNAPGGGAAGRTVIERYKVGANPDVADPSSHQLILAFDQPETNHKGGWIGFGNDGFLYIATGDGGGANDQHGSIGNAQDRNVLLGKILRIDVDRGSPYGIPPGNPFIGDATKKQEIWAFGLRNPWRCSIDRSTGDLWIGDVGQNDREEIDFDPAGAGGWNFGWRPREGTIANPNIAPETPVTAATDPVFDYSTHANGNNAVIGGYLYRGAALAGFQGTYFFGDYGGSHVYTFNFNGTAANNFTDRTTELTQTVQLGNISSFGEDAAGELYICDYSNGKVLRIVPAQTAPPTQSPLTVTKLAGTLNFKTSGKDKLSISGVLPVQPAFTPDGQSFSINLGGVSGTFLLTNNGASKIQGGLLSLKLKPGKKSKQTGKFEFFGGPVPFKADLKNGDFAGAWTSLGVDPQTTVKDKFVTIPVKVTFNGAVYDVLATIKYFSKAGASAHFSKTK